MVNDVLEEVRENQPQFKDMVAPIDKKEAHVFVNQHSREPKGGPDERVPLWKIFHLVGADWTYSSKGWAAENFCMFSGDEAAWYEVIKTRVDATNELGCAVWLNTECGHSYYTMWNAINRFGMERNNFV